MVLETITSAEDLRRLGPEQLELLADEIRQFIVQSVSVTGGHLGSNLGVVELTIALHRVFDSPHDILLWDTGHQAYVHKILTGRRERFPTLRQAGGLSGYPSRAESEHDWVENSHASTILSYAHGLATAMHLKGEERPAGRGRHRRRVDDGRHGLRGAQQHRPQRAQGPDRPQRQRPVLRPDGVAAGQRAQPAAAQPRRTSATSSACSGSCARCPWSASSWRSA